MREFLDSYANARKRLSTALEEAGQAVVAGSYAARRDELLAEIYAAQEVIHKLLPPATEPLD